MSKDKSEDEARNFENGLTEDDEDEFDPRFRSSSVSSSS